MHHRGKLFFDLGEENQPNEHNFWKTKNKERKKEIVQKTTEFTEKLWDFERIRSNNQRIIQRTKQCSIVVVIGNKLNQQ